MIPVSMDKAYLIIVEGMHKDGILNEESTVSGIASIGNLGLEGSSPQRATIGPWSIIDISAPRISDLVKAMHNVPTCVLQLVSTDYRVCVTCWKIVL
jgi:hypothetical protein